MEQIGNGYEVRPATGRAWLALLLAGVLLIAIAGFGFGTVVEGIGLTIEGIFTVALIRHLTFALSAMRSAPVDLWVPDAPEGVLPTVSVLVACKNEQAVVDSLVTTLLGLEYDRERVQLMFVDDASTDATGEMLDAWAARDERVECIHRPAGALGGKSAALNAALTSARGEVIVVFDADHQPRPDCLRRLTRHFVDPAVGAVQGRCVIRNGDDTALSQLVEIDYLAGYLVNEYGRQSIFGLPAYGGANCAVRASSLRALGGWNPYTVTEDTDLTLRLVLSGQRIRYDVTAVDEEEAVVTFGRYWRQRYRWARGHQQVWRDYHLAVWRSPRMSWFEKVESTLFLLAFHLPVVAMVGFVIAGLWISGLVPSPDGVGLSVYWTLLFLGPLLEVGAGMLIARVDRRHAVLVVFMIPLLVVGAAICTKAWLDAAIGRQYRWVKTARAEDAMAVPT
jgi:1,2-diacylglycerol 3-beta-glucosyltransferase